MRVLIAGSRNWVDHNEIMRKMTVILDEWVSSNPSDRKITFVHTASSPAENMITEYIGKVERLICQKGSAIDQQLVRPNRGKQWQGRLSINDISNLVALCPNCHWELDHGILVIQIMKFEDIPIGCSFKHPNVQDTVYIKTTKFIHEGIERNAVAEFPCFGEIIMIDLSIKPRDIDSWIILNEIQRNTSWI